MAWGLLYEANIFQYVSGLNDEYKLEIFKEGYGGASSEMELAKSPLTIRHNNTSVFDAIKQTTAKLKIIVTTEGQYDEFLTATYGEFKLVVTKDPNGTNEIIFNLYNQSEIGTESYIQPPYILDLKFTCGLSHLKFVRFDDAGTLYTGQKHVLEVLRLCLNQLPDNQNIIESVNVYEDGHAATVNDSPLTQTYVDSSVYIKEKETGGVKEVKGMFCFDVIKNILESFLSHIYHYNNAWYIVRIEEYADNNLNLRTYLPRPANESSTVLTSYELLDVRNTITGVDKGNPLELVPVGADAKSQTLEPLNRALLTFKSNSADFLHFNLLPYGRFKSLDFTGPVTSTYNGSPSFWTEGAGIDTTTYAAMLPRVNYSVLDGISHYGNQNEHLFRFGIGDDSALDNFDGTIYLEYSKTNVPVSTTDVFRLEFYYNFRTQFDGTAYSVFNWMRNSFVINFPIYVTFGAYYLRGDNINGYEWSLTSGVAYYKAFGHENLKNGGSTQLVYSGTSQAVIRQSLPTLPENGLKDFTFRIYKPLTTKQESPFTNPEMKHLNIGYLGLYYEPLNDSIVEDIKLYLEIDEDEEIFKRSIFHADAESYLSQNAFRLSTNVLTDSWQRRGKTESFKIMKIIAVTMASLRGQFIRQITIRLAGRVELYNTIVYTIGAVTSVYLIVSLKSFDIEKGIYNVVLMELKSFTGTTTITDQFTGDVRSSGSGGETDGVTVQDNPIKPGTATKELIVKQGVYARNTEDEILNFK